MMLEVNKSELKWNKPGNYLPLTASKLSILLTSSSDSRYLLIYDTVHTRYILFFFFRPLIHYIYIYICRLINLQFEREKGLLNIKKKGGYYNKVKIEIKEEEISEEVVESTLKRALRSYSTLQADDGFWPGDYGGPLFLLPGLVIN